MKKCTMELIMGCLLLAGFFILSRQAAQAFAGQAVSEAAEKSSGVIVIDPGHGGKKTCRNRCPVQKKTEIGNHKTVIHYKTE